MTSLRCVHLVLLAGLCLVGVACGADNKLPDNITAILDKADQVELYSLDPSRQKEIPAGADFHGWKVLGKTTVKDDARKALIAALKKGIKDSDGTVAACFNPRHGIRATVDGKTADVVICFECLSMSSFLGETKGSALTTRSPEKTFNKILTDAKVPMPPQREEK
jgi:hypothetical protein